MTTLSNVEQNVLSSPKDNLLQLYGLLANTAMRLNLTLKLKNKAPKKLYLNFILAKVLTFFNQNELEMSPYNKAPRIGILTIKLYIKSKAVKFNSITHKIKTKHKLPTKPRK